MRKKRANTRPILIALDTETQLVKDDTKIVNEIQQLKKELKTSELDVLKGVKPKKVYLDLKKINRPKIDDLERLTCNDIVTYALGWEELKPQKQSEKYYSQAIKIHDRNKHGGNWWTCPDCLELMSKKVKLITNFDNKTNVWGIFLEQIISRYPSIKKGKTKYARVYIHNLKFDARALEYYIINHINDFSNVECIVNNGIYYQISFNYKDHVFKFVDSLKLLTMPLSKVAKIVEMKKQTQDATYDWFDLKNERVKVKKELRYLAYDVLILQHGIEFIKNTTGTKALTAAGYAIKDLKKQLKDDDYQHDRDYHDRIFNTGFTFEQDTYIRRAYYGGETLVLPDKENYIHGLGFSADCNSMYPAAMLRNYPDPTSLFSLTASECKNWFDTFRYDPSEQSFAIFQIEVFNLKLKKGGIPFYPKKVARFGQTQAITDISDIIDTDMQSSYIATLSNIDLDMVLNEYDIDFKFIDGIASSRYLITPFKSFVDKHAKDKIKAKREHNEELKHIAKLSLNSSYGKLAERFHEEEEQLIEDENGDPIYIKVNNDEEWKQKGNILLAVFVTAYARRNLYEQCQNINSCSFTELNYVDTDSVHFTYKGKYFKQIDAIAKEYRAGNDVDQSKQEEIFVKICNECNIKYDPALFGYWKLEGFFDKAVYLAAKRYIEYDLIEGANVKVSGVQAVGRDYILKQGIEWFRYSNDNNIVVPFMAVKAVKNGYKFIDTFKVLTPSLQKIKDYFI